MVRVGINEAAALVADRAGVSPLTRWIGAAAADLIYQAVDVNGNPVNSATFDGSSVQTGALTLGSATTPGNITHIGPFGETAKIQFATEQLTLNTGALTTDTTANLLPANSLILAVIGRVTTTITTSASWGLSDPTTANRFSATDATLTAGEVIIGLAHWFGAVTTTAAGPTQAAAAKVRVTCVTSNPGAGVVRLTVVSLVFTGSTS